MRPSTPSCAAVAADPFIDSIKAAAKIAATKLRALYPNTEPWFVPGEFGLIQTADGKNDKGYYWWEAGAAMGVCFSSPQTCTLALTPVTVGLDRLLDLHRRRDLQRHCLPGNALPGR